MVSYRDIVTDDAAVALLHILEEKGIEAFKAALYVLVEPLTTDQFDEQTEIVYGRFVKDKTATELYEKYL